MGLDVGPLGIGEVGSLRPSGIMATTNIYLRQGRIRDLAYLYIGVTSNIGAGLCRVPGRVFSGVAG